MEACDGQFNVDNAYKIVWGVHGDKGVRKQMEDEHLVCHSLRETCPELPPSHDIGIYGVFDGHGGPQAAAFVREELPLEVGLQLLAYKKADERLGELDDPQAPHPEDPWSHDAATRQILDNAFLKLDSRIALELPNCKDGCTAIVVFVKGTRVVIANLGDSQAFLAKTLRGSLHAIPLNEVHKPWVIKEKERIITTGGTIENGRVSGALEITRSFGDLSFKKYGVLCTPTLRQITIDATSDAFIAIGCDGFWNCWPASEAIIKTRDLLQAEKRRTKATRVNQSAGFSAKAIANQLVEYVIVDKKTQDNVTVLLLFIEALGK